MKKTIQIFAVLLMLAMASCALADASVDYQNAWDLFEFKPGSSYEATDLFENFKGVLPGDVLEQKVVVKNSSALDVRIWLKQSPETYVWEGSEEDFLDQLRLTVKDGSKTLFDAPASEAAQLKEPVLLGLFEKLSGSQIELSVTLTVPHDLGNEYMGQVGVVPWTFIVEEIPDVDSPHTGDWYQSGAWLALAGVLAAAIVVVLLLMRRRKAEQ